MVMLYYAFGTKENISAGILSPLPNRCIRGDQPNIELEFRPTFSPASWFFPKLRRISRSRNAGTNRSTHPLRWLGVHCNTIGKDCQY
jgi:hypothetical protein